MSSPTLEKMRAVHPRSQAIGEFIEWLRHHKGWVIAERHCHGPQCEGWDEDRDKFNPGRGEPRCEFYDGQLFEASFSIEQLLAEYFEIDLGEADKEKRALLESLQASAETGKE